MNSKGQLRKSCVVSLASVLVASAALSQCVCLDSDSAFNPGNLPLTQTRQGAQSVLSVLEANQGAHAAAAAEDIWFRSPAVFSEYTYTDTRYRAAGVAEHIRDGSVGLSFLSACDVAMSVIARYNRDESGTRAFSDNDGLTLSAAKNIDWFLMGLSASYNGKYERNVTPKPDSTGTTIAPFIGAMYAQGNFSFSSVPTYMLNWNWMDYDSTGPTSADTHNAQDTFVWMNTANYSVTEKIAVGLMANWNRVTNVKKSVSAEVGDREWLTIGPKLSYKITPALSGYASCTKDLCNSTFASLQGVVGMNYAF